MKYLQRRGYRVIPVNPGRAGMEILGETVYATLAEVPVDIDMVDVFRSSEAALGVAEEAAALAKDKNIEIFWLQLGIRNDKAAELAQAAGMTVIMDRCPKIEFAQAEPHSRENGNYFLAGYGKGVTINDFPIAFPN